MEIARRFGGSLVQKVAGYGYAAFPPIAYLVTSRVADALVPGLYMLCFWMHIRAIEARRVTWWIGCGGVSAALWMLRPDYAALPIVLWLTALLLFPPRRPAVIGGVLMFAVVGLLVLPWALRNQRVLGVFTPGTTSSGMVLMQSIGQTANPYGIPVEDAYYSREAWRAGFEGIDDPRSEKMFRHRYLEIARKDPLLILRGFVQRLVLGALPPYHWGLPNPHYKGHGFYDYHDREGTGPIGTLLRHPREILLAYWDRFLFVPMSTILFAGCLVLLLRSGSAWRSAVLLVLPYAYVVLVHLPLYMTVRMMLPGVFAQLIALGCAIELLRGRPLTSVGR